MDFRTFVDLLDSTDELLWIKPEVDPEYELSALLQQAEARGKAIWFEQVKGSSYPVVGAVMLNTDRHALSIGRLPGSLRAPGGWSKLFDDARANPLTATVVDSGPAGEVVQTGNNIDVTKLPIPFSFPGDTHKFITAGLGIATDPESGIPNVGFYRAPVIDGQHISVSAGATSRLNEIYQAAAKQQQPLKVAYIIGAPPALLLTAGYRVGRDENDLEIGGALQGKPLELMTCQTSDLLVPATAEFVIETEIDFSQQIEHTMGEFPDNYGTTQSPVARITAITHRSDAVFHTILGGMNREHNSLGANIFTGLREQLLAELQDEFPSLQDIHVDLRPRRTGGRCQIAASLNKAVADEPAALIDAIYARSFDTFPLALVAQRVIVVDPDVNIHISDDVEWAISTRVSSEQQIRAIEMTRPGGGTIARLAIDATLPLEGRNTGKRPEIPDTDKYSLDRYL
jgi:4-hydroxy-3-polyprenylbenzoate decarboxylase/2,5-furandicarboxylate decarboxylase 1